MHHQRLMREVNDRIAEFARRVEDGDDTFDFLCECGDPQCAATVKMALDDYPKRASAGWVLAEEHYPSPEQQVA
jgi:hypothetical protein